MKFCIKILLVFFPFCSFAQEDTNLLVASLIDSTQFNESSSSINICDSLICHAKKHLGIPYRYQGSSPKTGFDCSGFVCYNFKKFNITLPRSSYDQMKTGMLINKADAKPGDLIFFKGSSLKSKKAGHVGIVVKKNKSSIYFIHAAVKGGIRYDSTNADYYKKRYLSIRRVPIKQ